MTIRASNWQELNRRGASLDNTDYVMLKCDKCGNFALYDEERMQIFLSPDDLAVAALYGFDGAEAIACISCGAVDSFKDAVVSDIDAIAAGSWAFASPTDTPD